MKAGYRPIAAAAAGLRQAFLRVPAATAASPSATASSTLSASSTPTCQCGNVRLASSRARPSPTVRKAARQATRRRAPLEQHQQHQQHQQQQHQPAQASSRGRAAGGPMSGSIFPDDLSVLVPALEAATEMAGSVLTEDEFTHVLSSASKIIEGHWPVAEAELNSDYNITPYQLHMAAVLLLYGHKAVPETIPCLFIALSLMHLATAAVRQPGGYLPSTLTIVNMIAAQWPQSAAKSDALRKTSIYHNAERQFLAYLAKQNSAGATASPADNDDDGEHPATVSDLSLQADAFTLAGVLAEAAGEPDRALQWYLAARELGNASAAHGEDGEDGENGENGSVPVDLPTDLPTDLAADDTEPREVRWSWEQRCLEGIGRLHLAGMKLERAEKAAGGGSVHRSAQTDEEHREAKAALRTAALALGSGNAGLWLATDYATESDTGDDLDMMLYRAAVHAVPGAYDALAKREATKASVLRGLNSSKVTGDAAFHQMMADEWQKLAEASKTA